MRGIDRFASNGPRFARTLVLLALAGLAACGGGYGGGGGGGGGGGRPTVTLSAAPSTITLGQSTTLTWSSSTGTTCTATGGWSGAKAATGSESVTPAATGSVTYTIDCSGGTYGKSGSATTTVTVNAPSSFTATSLVTDAVGTGAVSTDPNLVNAWGIAFGPTTPAWVANNHSGTSTIYDGNGKRQPFAAPLVVNLPQGGGGDFSPTGIVFNGSAGFVVSAAGKTAAARFIFDGEGGMIAGWAPSVDVGNAVVMYTDAGGANYKGLAIGSNGAATFLYAADFHNNKVDVFDASYVKQAVTATSFAFTDPNLPAGYAPFGIQAIANGTAGATQIYVAYAKQAPPDNADEQAGAGLGIVDIYDANGVFVKRLVSDGGKLNAPWGMALAPANAGSVSNALLVGNFGDGKINAFDPATGAYIGTVADSAGQPFALPGLWGIAFGNGSNNQPTNTLFYAAGTNDEANGAFGRIDLGATAPALNTPPVVALTAPSGTVSGTTNLTATATATVNIAKVEFFLNGATSLGSVTTSPYTLPWNTTTVADGVVNLTAKATDVDGNAGTSPAVAITVANAAPATKLSELQTLVFTPLCSTCHNGSNAPGGALPGSQDLRAGHSYAALVGVASLEQPALQRVKAGDAANSYLVRKLEGAASISGSRMPLGGPFLDQATIDKVKSWIAAGALDN
jgi:uncharacterized protein (TIGR03118 family)